MVFNLALATDFSGGNFIVRDPVISEYGGRATSAGFEQISSGGQAAIGESTSASFIIKSGFLYFTDLLSAPSPLPSPGPGPSSGGGGGGGGGPLAPTPGPFSGVVFGGLAYPLQPVVLLKDGQVVATTTASVVGEFYLAAYDLTNGNYNFGIVGTDINGQIGPLFFLISFERGLSKRIDDVILPPTIAIDRENILGQTAPLAEVTITIGSLTKKTAANNLGIYLLPYRKLGLKDDVYRVRSEALLTDGRRSPLSREVMLDLRGEVSEVGKCPLKGDLNADCRVNLVDLSIMAYWWSGSGVPARIDLNGDGKINLSDFSILVYYWTG